MEQTVEQRAEQLLDDQVRPYLLQHQGNIQLIEIKDSVAYVKFLGHCAGCASADDTMNERVSSALLSLDEISQVRLVTDLDSSLIEVALSILRK